MSTKPAKPGKAQVVLTILLAVVCFPVLMIAPRSGLSPTSPYMVAIVGIFVGCAKALLTSNFGSLYKKPSYLLGGSWPNRLISGFALLILACLVGAAFYSHHENLMPTMVWFWIIAGSKLYKLGPKAVIAYYDFDSAACR